MITSDFASISRLNVDIADLRAAKAQWKREPFDKFESHGRPVDLLYLMLSGRRSYCVDGRELLQLNSGQAIFIPTGQTYTSQVISEGISSGIYIDFSLYQSGERLFIDNPFRVFENDGILRRFTAISENTHDRMRMRCELYGLLSELSAIAASGALTAEENKIRNAALGIERRLEVQPNIAELAKSCHMSMTGFREKFKRYTGGYSPLEYRNKLRCERAEELLGSGSFTAAQVATLLGFFDVSHFYRTLRKHREDRRYGEIYKC